MNPKQISRLDLPNKNLVLTGFIGVGKTTVGRQIVRQLGVDFLDVDEEIELRELMSIAKIRELYGDSRLRALEHDLCREASLMHRAVIVVTGAALLDPRNFDLLTETGQVVCLTCELGEILRRMHLRSEQHYRDKSIRHRLLSRLRRERAIMDDQRLVKLNTTHLSIEEECDLLVKFWRTGEVEEPPFHYGPLLSIKPPAKPPVGLSQLSADRP